MPTQIPTESPTVRTWRATDTEGADVCPRVWSGPAVGVGPSEIRSECLPKPDQVRRFALAAADRVGALIRCEERFPVTGHHSVLYVVVENNTAEVQNSLSCLHQELFGAEHEDPLAPVKLQVVNRATHVAVYELIKNGLLQSTCRTWRTVWPLNKDEAAPIPLSAAEIQKAGAYRRAAAHRLRVARVLIAGGLVGEARSSLLEAMLALARALAVDQRLPEPEALSESLLPPFSECWGKDLPLFRRFASDPSDSCAAVVESLIKLGVTD